MEEIDVNEVKEGLRMTMVAGMIIRDAEFLKNLLARGSEVETIREMVSPNKNVDTAIEEMDRRLAKDIFLLLASGEYKTANNTLTEIVKVFPINIRRLFEKIIEEWLVTQERKRYKAVNST